MTDLFGLPAADSMTCPQCGRVFERPVKVDGKRINGHPSGDPRLCVPVAGSPGVKAARKSTKRG